ncbi:MAG: hypothetical protein ACRC2S_10565 [Waterburya sp.]
MTQSLTDLFGATATKTGTSITINLNDFDDASGSNLLADSATATPAQALAAWLSWLHRTQMPATDANGAVIVDKTDTLVPQTSFSPKTFEVRENVSQIKNEFNFAIYTADATAFDPDNAV